MSIFDEIGSVAENFHNKLDKIILKCFPKFLEFFTLLKTHVRDAFIMKPQGNL
jgi:hypothetical protein